MYHSRLTDWVDCLWWEGCGLMRRLLGCRAGPPEAGPAAEARRAGGPAAHARGAEDLHHQRHPRLL